MGNQKEFIAIYGARVHNLKNVNLKSANLTNCNLLGANLENTKLENVNWGPNNIIIKEIINKIILIII